MTFRTDRLIAERLRAEDLAELCRMHQDPSVMATLGGLRSEVFRCVECARLDLTQRLRLMARAAEWEIIGPQGEEGDPVPGERNGIRRTCPARQTPLPGGAIRFFKRGTDEFK